MVAERNARAVRRDRAGSALRYDRPASSAFRRPASHPKPMPAERIPVEVDVERVPLASRWADSSWRPARLVPSAPATGGGDACAWRPVDAEGALERWRYDGLSLELHRTEAEGYYLNLASPEPKAFVMWRVNDDANPPVDIVVVTLSYHEAARMLDGGEQVDAVPLDPRLRSALEPFVAEHYKPEPRRKVKRNDPFDDGAFVRDRERGRR